MQRFAEVTCRFVTTGEEPSWTPWLLDSTAGLERAAIMEEQDPVLISPYVAKDTVKKAWRKAL